MSASVFYSAPAGMAFFIGTQTGLDGYPGDLKGTSDLGGLRIMGKEEKKAVSEISVPTVTNFVDDPRNPSSSTVSSIPEFVDELKKSEEKDKEEEKIPEGKEEKKKDDDKTKTEDTSDSEEQNDGEVEEDVEKKEEKKDAVAKRIEAITKKAQEAQERINEATRARRQKERELQVEIKKNQDLQKEIEKLKTAKPVAAKPKMEDFESEADFIEALTDWKLETRMAAAEKLQDSNLESNLANQEESRIASIITQQMKSGSKKYKDFDAVVKNETTPISMDMLKIISESEMGDEILYHLGTHLDKAEEIFEMDIPAAALTIGRIEAELSRPVKKTVTTTKTPAPIKPVQTTQTYEPSLDSGSYEDYKRLRKAQKK